MKLIDKNVFLDLVKKNAPHIYHIAGVIANITPEVNAIPAVHGRWMKETDPTSYSTFTACSICGSAADETDYCPYCGADMRGDENAR